jgi:hypothetical protein
LHFHEASMTGLWRLQATYGDGPVGCMAADQKLLNRAYRQPVSLAGGEGA